MKELTIKINGVQEARDFVKSAGSFECTVDLKQGRYIVDGQSVLAIFSLDLMQTIDCEIFGDNEEEVNACYGALQRFKQGEITWD